MFTFRLALAAIVATSMGQITNAWMQLPHQANTRRFTNHFATTSSDAVSNGFTSDETKLVERLFEEGKGDSKSLKTAVLESLPTMPPTLLVKLRQAAENPNKAVAQTAQALQSILNERLDTARKTLLSLLNAGEVRKLDGLIGKAARDGNLDAAFFNVLTINIRDAMEEEKKNPPKEKTGDDGEEPSASRLQVLQHIYTRCQEEVEKTIPPGMALLNKLLRTDQESIRANLYEHYLTPQKNIIKTPDGKEVELWSKEPNVLVSIKDFIAAIDTAVVQVRNVEQAGGTDPASGAAMVEGCRQIAKEARVIIGKSYGIDSEELKVFEKGLQPVFRPPSADSKYIKGEK